MIKISRIAAGAILLASVSMADIYNLTVTNTTLSETVKIGSNNLEDTIDTFDFTQLKNQFSGYSSTDGINAVLDMRGLPVTLNMAGTTVTFAVPSLGISETFTGHSRDESIDQLQDWFKKNGATTIERIMKEMVKVSPIDPIAGNSNSTMHKTVEADYSAGFLNIASKQRGVKSQTDSNGNIISIDPTYRSMKINGKSSDSITLPIAYSFVSDDNRDQKLTINLPISYVDVEGAKSYNLGFGLAYNYPINSKWTLTPAISYNLAGSMDLATLAQLGSASLTSSYTYTLPNKHRLSIGNMVSYVTTLKFYSGDYAYDPGITNTVFRNGLMYSMDTEELMNNTSVDFFVINTKYTGTELYNEDYNEFGVSFGFNDVSVNKLGEKVYSTANDFKIGLSYLKADDEKGFKVNFGFTF